MQPVASKVSIEKRQAEVVIIGGGISGLSCAKSLIASGLKSVLVLEADSKGATLTEFAMK